MSEPVISEIQITPLKSQDGLVAFCSFILNGQFYIGSIAIYTSPVSENGFRIVYPSRKLKNGTQLNLVHPINRETGIAVQNCIVKEYLKLMEDLMKEAKNDSTQHKKIG